METDRNQFSSVLIRCRNELASLSKSLQWHDEDDHMAALLHSVEIKSGACGVTILQIMKFLIPSAVSSHALKNLVQLFLRKISVLMEELQILRNEKLATEALAVVKNFWSLVSNQHVVITKQVFGRYSPELYVVLPSLASVYVDLFIAVHRDKVKLDMVSRRLYGWLMFELNERCLKTALLEVSECTKEGARLLLPLLRKLLSDPPHTESFLDYLLHIILLKRWSFVCKELKDLLQISLNIKAPKNFVEWLAPQWTQSKDHLPVDKSLKGRRVSEVLLELDEKAIEELIDVFCQCLWASEQDAVTVGADKANQQKNTEEKTMDSLFMIDKKGGEVDKEELDEEMPPPKKRKKLKSQESEELETPFDKETQEDYNIIDENDDTDIFMLPGLLDDNSYSESNDKSEKKKKHEKDKAGLLKSTKSEDWKIEEVIKQKRRSGLDAEIESNQTQRMSSPTKSNGRDVSEASDESEDEEGDMDWAEDETDVHLKGAKDMNDQQEEEEDEEDDDDSDEDEDDGDVDKEAPEEIEQEKNVSDESSSDKSKDEKSHASVNGMPKSPARNQNISAVKTPKMEAASAQGYVVDRTAAKLSPGRRKSDSGSKDPASTYFIDKSPKQGKSVQGKSAGDETEPDIEVIDGMEIQVYDVTEDMPEVISEKKTGVSPARMRKGSKSEENGTSSATPSKTTDRTEVSSKLSETKSMKVHRAQREVDEKGDSRAVKSPARAKVAKSTQNLSSQSVVISSDSDGDNAISISDSSKSSDSQSKQDPGKKNSKVKSPFRQTTLHKEDGFLSIKMHTSDAGNETERQKRPRTRSESSTQNEAETTPTSDAVSEKGGAETNSPNKEKVKKTTEYQVALMLSEMRKSVEAGKLSHVTTRLRRKSESTTDSPGKEHITDSPVKKGTAQSSAKSSVKKLQHSPAATAEDEGTAGTPKHQKTEGRQQALTSIRSQTPRSANNDTAGFINVLKDWFVKSPSTPGRIMKNSTPKDITDEEIVEKKSSQRKRRSVSNDQVSLDVSKVEKVTPRSRKKSDTEATPVDNSEREKTPLSAKRSQRVPSPSKAMNSSLTPKTKEVMGEKSSTPNNTSIKGASLVGDELNTDNVPMQSVQTLTGKGKKLSATSKESDLDSSSAGTRSSEKAKSSSTKRRYFLRTNCSHRSYDSAECPTCTPKRKTRQSEKEALQDDEKQVTSASPRSSSKRSTSASRRGSNKSPANRGAR